MKEVIKILSSLRDIMTVGILITSLVPKSFNKIIFILLVFLWFLLAYICNSRSIIVTFIKPSIRTYSIYIWLIVYITFYLIGYTNGFESYLLNYVRIGFSILLINYYFELKNYNAIRKLAVISTFIICFVCITTVNALGADKTVVRQLSTGLENVTKNIHGIVGNFDFIYGLVFISIAIIGCLFEKVITNNRIFWIITLGLMVFTIYEASFMIALLLFIGITMLIIFRVNRIHNLIILFVIFVLGLAICSPIIYQILIHLSKTVKSYDLSIRFYELSELLISGSTKNTVDMYARIDFYIISIKSFLTNPFFGIGGFYGYDSAAFGVGGHSAFLDELARYGFLGAMPLIIGFTENFKYIYKKLNASMKNVYSKCIIAFFVLGLINTMLFIPLIIMVFFVVPGLLIYFEKNGDHENLGSAKKILPLLLRGMKRLVEFPVKD